MSKAKIVVTPLACHFKHNSAQAPTSEKEQEEIWSVIYASVVGSLIYVMVCIRLDIAHAVKAVSQFLFNLWKEHCLAIKWIFKCLRGTSKLCLCFGNDKPALSSFADADLGDDIDCRKSISGFMHIFAGELVSWQFKL